MGLLNMFDSQLLNVIVFGLVALLLAPTTLAGPVKRAADPSNPCNLAGGSDGEAATPDLPALIADMKELTDGVRQQASNTKATTREYIIHQINGEAVIKELDKPKHTFIDSDALATVAEDEINAITDMSSVLYQHWVHLINITNLVHITRHDGEIGQSQANDDSNTSILRNNLDEIESSTDSVTCKLFIALKSLDGSEPAVPDVSLPKNFMAFGGSLTHEYYRVYMLMKDFEQVMGRLHDVYSVM